MTKKFLFFFIVLSATVVTSYTSPLFAQTKENQFIVKSNSVQKNAVQSSAVQTKVAPSSAVQNGQVPGIVRSSNGTSYRSSNNVAPLGYNIPNIQPNPAYGAYPGQMNQPRPRVGLGFNGIPFDGSHREATRIRRSYRNGYRY